MNKKDIKSKLKREQNNFYVSVEEQAKRGEAELSILKILYSEKYNFSYGDIFLILSKLIGTFSNNLAKDEKKNNSTEGS